MRNVQQNAKAKLAEVSPAIVNNTTKSISEIEANYPIVGLIKNNWRQRNVWLRTGETDGYLYMIGVSFDGKQVVISHEAAGLNEKVAMDYWQHGQKVYVRD